LGGAKGHLGMTELLGTLLRAKRKEGKVQGVDGESNNGKRNHLDGRVKKETEGCHERRSVLDGGCPHKPPPPPHPPKNPPTPPPPHPPPPWGGGGGGWVGGGFLVFVSGGFCLCWGGVGVWTTPPPPPIKPPPPKNPHPPPPPTPKQKPTPHPPPPTPRASGRFQRKRMLVWLLGSRENFRTSSIGKNRGGAEIHVQGERSCCLEEGGE